MELGERVVWWWLTITRNASPVSAGPGQPMNKVEALQLVSVGVLRPWRKRWEVPSRSCCSR